MASPWPSAPSSRACARHSRTARTRRFISRPTRPCNTDSWSRPWTRFASPASRSWAWSPSPCGGHELLERGSRNSHAIISPPGTPEGRADAAPARGARQGAHRVRHRPPRGRGGVRGLGPLGNVRSPHGARGEPLPLDRRRRHPFRQSCRAAHPDTSAAGADARARARAAAARGGEAGGSGSSLAHGGAQGGRARSPTPRDAVGAARKDVRGADDAPARRGPRAVNGLSGRAGQHDPRRNRLSARLVSSPGAAEGRRALADAESPERARAEATDIRGNTAGRHHRHSAHRTELGEQLLRPRSLARHFGGEPIPAPSRRLEQTRSARAVQLRAQARMTRPHNLRRSLAAGAALLTLVLAGLALLRPLPARSQSPDVELNVRPGQVKKINIAIPDFTLVGGADPQNW